MSLLFQLNHRILAMTTLSAVGALWLASRRINLHPAVQSLIGSTLGMAALQVIHFFRINGLLEYSCFRCALHYCSEMIFLLC